MCVQQIGMIYDVPFPIFMYVCNLNFCVFLKLYHHGFNWVCTRIVHTLCSHIYFNFFNCVHYHHDIYYIHVHSTCTRSTPPLLPDVIPPLFIIGMATASWPILFVVKRLQIQLNFTQKPRTLRVPQLNNDLIIAVPRG